MALYISFIYTYRFFLQITTNLTGSNGAERLVMQNSVP